jgi:protease I
MASDLAGLKIAFLMANEGVEAVELTEPRQAVEAAGGKAEILAPETGDVQTFNHLEQADTVPVDRAVADASVDDYDGLVLPGGVANPDNLRTHPAAVRLIADFFAAGKPVAAICHAPWTLIEAGVVSGRRLTSWPSLRTDITNAGGSWVDEEVVVDGNLTTSRKPDDLPAFCAQAVAAFASTRAAA